MARPDFSTKINALFDQEKWDEAQTLLMARQRREPASHWLLTQLAATYYEQRDYAKAEDLLIKSCDLKPDCPLTLWHLAGAWDALAKWDQAIKIYAWLIGAKRTAKDDPCWESPEWTRALKADCVYRLGGCFEAVGKRQEAMDCFLQYLALLGSGVSGLYSYDDVRDRLRKLQRLEGKKASSKRQDQALAAVLETGNLGAVSSLVLPPIPAIADAHVMGH